MIVPTTVDAEVASRSETVRGMPFEITIEQMVPERLLSFRWHPFAVEPGVDYSAEPTTLVVFGWRSSRTASRLTITESGFDRIPLARRAKAFTANELRLDHGGEVDREVPARCAVVAPTGAPESSARLFAALGDETRLRLVARLCDAARCPSPASRRVRGHRQAITKHLRVMEGAGSSAARATGARASGNSTTGAWKRLATTSTRSPDSGTAPWPPPQLRRALNGGEHESSGPLLT